MTTRNRSSRGRREPAPSQHSEARLGRGLSTDRAGRMQVVPARSVPDALSTASAFEVDESQTNGTKIENLAAAYNALLESHEDLRGKYNALLAELRQAGFLEGRA